MRYHIDTIPVWDAYREDSECPLCDLRARNEQAYAESFLGASVMEPAVRIEVNEKGFCARHFAMMLPMKNRLGLALITHTHLKETMDRQSSAPPKKSGLFGGKRQAAQDDFDACVLCERLETTMNRYLYTVLHLWKTDSDFKAALESSKGLCAPHYTRLSSLARETLGGRSEQFLQMLDALQRENMARIEKELEWFTLKFDYRNADKPWGNSKDAPERAINKLRGKCV